MDSTTRNVQVEATLANSKHQLLPGMFANALVNVGEKKHYLTLPQTRNYLQPLRLNRICCQTCGGKRRRECCAASATDLEVQQAFVTTGETRGEPGGDYEWTEGRRDGGYQRTDQAQERHAYSYRQFGAAGQ